VDETESDKETVVDSDDENELMKESDSNPEDVLYLLSVTDAHSDTETVVDASSLGLPVVEIVLEGATDPLPEREPLPDPDADSEDDADPDPLPDSLLLPVPVTVSDSETEFEPEPLEHAVEL
jgi:hypothetical protein